MCGSLRYLIIELCGKCEVRFEIWDCDWDFYFSVCYCSRTLSLMMSVPFVSLRERMRERERLLFNNNLDTPTGYTNYFYIRKKQNGLFIYEC